MDEESTLRGDFLNTHVSTALQASARYSSIGARPTSQSMSGKMNLRDSAVLKDSRQLNNFGGDYSMMERPTHLSIVADSVRTTISPMARRPPT